MTPGLTTVEHSLRGAVEPVVDRHGLVAHRTPGVGRQRLGDAGFEYTSGIPSGVRLTAMTDVSAVELELQLLRFPLDDRTTATVDLVVDGVVTAASVLPVTPIGFDPATRRLSYDSEVTETARFDLGAAGVTRRVELWLPSTVFTRIRDLRLIGGRSWQPIDDDGARRWVHHGSSISQCSEVTRPTTTWPAIVALRQQLDLLNLGLGGNCQLDPFMAQVIRDTAADAISLELGINVVAGDTMRERTFVTALHGFLDTVRAGHPRTPIAVVSPIACPAVETAPGPLLYEDGVVHAPERPELLAPGALTLRRVRAVLAAAVEQRRAEGDEYLHLIDGLRLFGPADVADLPDGLHPNTAGYARMADRFLRAAFGPSGVLVPDRQPAAARSPGSPTSGGAGS